MYTNTTGVTYDLVTVYIFPRKSVGRKFCILLLVLDKNESTQILVPTLYHNIINNQSFTN